MIEEVHREAQLPAESSQLRRRRIRLLVDEVANIRQNAVAQIHAQETRTKRSLQISFKILEHKCRQVGLAPKQAQQRCAIGWAFIVAG